jgi:hypothetical protein
MDVDLEGMSTAIGGSGHDAGMLGDGGLSDDEEGAEPLGGAASAEEQAMLEHEVTATAATLAGAINSCRAKLTGQGGGAQRAGASSGLGSGAATLGAAVGGGGASISGPDGQAAGNGGGFSDAPGAADAEPGCSVSVDSDDAELCNSNAAGQATAVAAAAEPCSANTAAGGGSGGGAPLPAAAEGIFTSREEAAGAAAAQAVGVGGAGLGWGVGGGSSDPAAAIISRGQHAAGVREQDTRALLEAVGELQAAAQIWISAFGSAQRVGASRQCGEEAQAAAGQLVEQVRLH